MIQNKMNNKLFIPIAIIIAGVLIAGVVVYTNSSDQGESIGLEEAAEKVMSFVNDSVLKGQGTATLVDTLEENGLYKVKFDVDGQEVEWRITKDGELILPQIINLAEIDAEEAPEEETIGGFSVSGGETIMEEGKPVIYFFGSETCQHCRWEHPIMKEVVSKFDGYISYHDNMDTDADADIFSKYSAEGYVPATVIGGNYYRVGSGETIGEKANAEALTALICKLTNNQPAEVCSEVQELINSI